MLEPAPSVSAPRPGFGARLLLAVLAAALLAYAILAWTLVTQGGGPERYVRRTDFQSVLIGAGILQDGRPVGLYDEAAQQAAQNDLLRPFGLQSIELLPYIHPPFEALLVVGLLALGVSPAGTFAILTLLSLAAVGAAAVLLDRAWTGPGTARPLLIVAGLAFFPVTVGLLLGQSTAFVLLGWAAGSAALRRGSDRWAGVAFALALLKPQAMPVLLLALLCMGRWRTLLACAATAAAACVAVMPFLGWDWPIRYGAFVLRVATWPPSPALDPAAMQNWRGLFSHLLGDGAAATLLTAVATALSVAVVVAVWLRARGRAAGWDRRWALTLILALLVDPHLWPHDLTLALVPGWILAAAAIRRGDRAWLGWLGLGWLLGLVAGVARDVPLTPAVLWLVATAAVLGWADLRAAPAGRPAAAPTAAAPGRPGGT